MALVVEDGSGVSGANSLVSPSFAAEYHADRGGLTESLSTTVLSAVFSSSSSTVTVPATGSSVPAGSIVQLSGASEAANNSFAYVDSVSGDVLTVSWVDGMVDETVASLSLFVFEKNGWWSSRRRLEASLVNATEWLSHKSWRGTAVKQEQGVPFPRKGLVVASNGQFYSRGYRVPDDEVPLAVRFATCHLALEDVSSTVASVERVNSVLKSKKIDEIEREFEVVRLTREYPVVDRMIVGLTSVLTGPFIELAAG